MLLNGTEIARTANQHRSYRFDVTSALRDGDNDLEVRFEGPVSAAQRLSTELGDRPRAYAHPFNAIRKMAAGYGWDWGPDLAGAGIWRSVGIESWSGVRLGSVRPLALVEGTSGRLATHVELEWADASGDAVEVAVTLGDRTVTAEAAPGQTAVELELTVPEVELWWPRGLRRPDALRRDRRGGRPVVRRRRRLPHRRAVDHPGRVRHRLLPGDQRHARSTSGASTGSPTTRCSPG